MAVSILIFKKIKDGNIEAFETLFRSYYEPLCRYAYQWVEDRDAAEEVVQDLFYILWKERQNLQIFTSVNGYLYRSVKNKSLQYVEKEKIREEYRNRYPEDTMIETYTPQDDLEYKELEEQIGEALHRLPDRRQKIFRMNRMDGKKYHEIAQELHISVKTVEAEISKVLQVLRNKYNAIYDSRDRNARIRMHETK